MILLKDFTVQGETLGENESYALIPTGEVRYPLKGEWYIFDNNHAMACKDYVNIMGEICNLVVVKQEIVRCIKDTTEYPLNEQDTFSGFQLNDLGIRGVKTGEIRLPTHSRNEFCIVNGKLQSTIWCNAFKPVAIAKLVRTKDKAGDE